MAMALISSQSGLRMLYVRGNFAWGVIKPQITLEHSLLLVPKFHSKLSLVIATSQ